MNGASDSSCSYSGRIGAQHGTVSAADCSGPRLLVAAAQSAGVWGAADRRIAPRCGGGPGDCSRSYPSFQQRTFPPFDADMRTARDPFACASVCPLSSSAILPEFLGYRFEVHNGKKFYPIEVKANMVRYEHRVKKRSEASMDTLGGVAGIGAECGIRLTRSHCLWPVSLLLRSFSPRQIGKKFGEFAPTRTYPKHPEKVTLGTGPPKK